MNEMEHYKKQVKENIEYLINNNDIDSAKKFIKDYEDLTPNDVEIYSFKAIIAMIENDIELALMYLNEGIEMSRGNFDLYYNLAYLYESNKKWDKAYYNYKKALENADLGPCEEVEKKIEVIKKNYKFSVEETKVPKITIVTLVYNSKEYIEECVESVLNQSFKDFEWVVLDNGCTDGTSNILEKYAQKDNRIKLYRNEVNSFIHKKQHNFDYIDHINNYKSEYVCFLDSDDYLHKDFLKELYEMAKDNNSDISAAGFEMFNDEDVDDRSNKCPIELNVRDIKNIGNKDVFKYVYSCFRPMWGKLIRSSIAIKGRREFRFNNIQTSSGADTIFSLTYLELAKSVYFRSIPLYYYRIRKTSTYNTDINRNRYADYIKIYYKSKKLLNDWGSLNDENIFFIASVLYFSLRDCIEIASLSVNVPIEDRIELITAIISDNDVRKILNNSSIFMNLIEDSISGLNMIAKLSRDMNS